MAIEPGNKANANVHVQLCLTVADPHLNFFSAKKTGWPNPADS